MGRGDLPPLRSLPRFFVAALRETEEPLEPGFRFEIPEDELKKLRHVLRMDTGDQIVVLPGDGRILRCEIDRREAVIVALEGIAPIPKRRITLAQGIPKPEKLEEVVRMGTEMGVAEFWIFPSHRTVVKWDEKKRADRLRRLSSIAREAAEVCFRGDVPTIHFLDSLKAVLERDSAAIVLSESEKPMPYLPEVLRDPCTLVIGPEGGWEPREVALIGDRGVTLGPLVLRVDTAAAAACALALQG